MKIVAFSLPSLWWIAPVAATIALVVWQRKRLRITPLRCIAFGILLAALLNPAVLLQPQSVAEAAYNLQIVKPRVLLVEYGGGKTFLGTVFGKDSPVTADIVSPDDLPMVTDMLRKYDVVTLHTTKNLQIYTDFLSDWHSFPYRSKLESVFSDYGVVFENGTQTLPKELDNYGLIVLAGADIKPEDAGRLTDYVSKGGRVLALLHVAGGKGVNPRGNKDPWCILFHHPPFGDVPFPDNLVQRNTATWLLNSLGLKSMENIACIYGKMVVQRSDLSVLSNIYTAGALYPSTSIDGKEFDKLDWTTAFIDYDPAWQPLLTIDTKYSEEPTGHGTPITVPVQGKPVAIARQFGNGKVFVFGYGSVNYGTYGIPPSFLLAAAPYVGSELSYNAATTQALANYVTGGGNLLVVGPSLPKSTSGPKLTDLLPVNISGPQISEDTKAVFRNASHPVLSGIAPFLVSHYRVSGLKANGEALAVDGKNNPVLASAYYGQGKVVYYLPEIPVEATLNNSPPPDFWWRLILWLSPSDAGAPGRNASLALQSGKQVPFSIRVTDDYGKPVQKADVSCEYRSPVGTSDTVKLKETTAGTYSGQLSLDTPGEYTLAYYVSAGTIMRTSPTTLSVVATGPSIERALWKGIAFLDGYRTSTPVMMKLPLWQLLVAIGFCVLCVDWVRGILRGRI